ncbi:hypothetical protein PVAG01_09150 [Phlyctema vagabunda]|uniref:DUF1479-domain-containing protein n=1 Tax=Phlyctema vagabunda TaxID=108571 RepID=A0ABR4P6I8_9HELO
MIAARRPFVVSISQAVLRTSQQSRGLATAVAAKKSPGNNKKEGDISSVFVSLSGTKAEQLPPRFAEIKRQLIRGHEERLTASWKSLLEQLAVENAFIASRGPDIIPQIDFTDLASPPRDFLAEVKKRGVAVVKGVVPEQEARSYKDGVEEYVRENPWTKAFPQNDPQVFELYWSPSQVRARAHKNMVSAQRFLMNLWHSVDQETLISNSLPLAYADRVRIRQPGDAGFALGAHVDGGSVERWEPEGYGLGDPYAKIFAGQWEEYDAWESSSRVPVRSDLYDGAGSCSMFRMFQGWLGMSHTGPREGTLKVNPNIQLSTAYYLLRPFFAPIQPAKSLTAGENTAEYLQPENWRLQTGDEITSELHGATPGHGQEMNNILHPHLELQKTMIHIPQIKPGDFVVWHCDTIHAVDKIHEGKTDSSVMYIPVCPTTEVNAEYLVRQRSAFLGGFPGPDFPGGKGESEHSGRPTTSFLEAYGGNESLQAMGLLGLHIDTNEGPGAQEAVRRANSILGFD